MGRRGAPHPRDLRRRRAARRGGRDLADPVAEHARGELGYWVGAGMWGRGYATEAARAVVSFGFATLGLNRIQARHFLRNPASGRVLQKLGMRCEGMHRQAYRRWGRFEDVAVYAILASEASR
ncbi:MAG TPA: GNAT family protein [Gemmatimonadaceae bacterium]|nr:GNAT family protein [Gemmatimonadaceae bacterium]